MESSLLNMKDPETSRKELVQYQIALISTVCYDAHKQLQFLSYFTKCITRFILDVYSSAVSSTVFILILSLILYS